jgi:hypothetical protein
MPPKRGEKANEVPQPRIEIVAAKSYSIPNRSLLSIEHPAILSSVDVGIRTLGGPSAVSKVLSTVIPVYLRLRRIMMKQHSSYDIVLMTFTNTL